MLLKSCPFTQNSPQCKAQVEKTYFLSFVELPKTIDRLEQVKRLNPPGVVLFTFWKFKRMYLGAELVTAQPLIRAVTWREWMYSSPTPQEQSKVIASFSSRLKSWRTLGFVHGDLSWHNLLVTNDLQVLAIDWILNLGSREGTPLFAHPLVKQGIHNSDTDLFSANRICALTLKSARTGALSVIP